MSICAPSAQWDQTIPRCWSLEQRKVYFRVMHREWVAHSSQSPKLPEEFQQTILKGKLEVVGYCKLQCIGILCSYSLPCRSGQDVLVSLWKKQMLFSVLQFFISLWVENCYTLKDQSLENRLFCIFQAIGNILYFSSIQFSRSVVSDSLRPHESQHARPPCPSPTPRVHLIQVFATPWTVALQAPLSMQFSRQEYWSGLPSPPPGDLPNPGINPCLLHFQHWQAGSLPLEPPGKL